MREQRKRQKLHFSQQKSKTSKIIKKEVKQYQAEKVQLFKLNKENFNQFSRNDCNKFQKIKKQTIFLIQLDKDKIKQNVKALVQFQQQQNQIKQQNKQKFNINEFISIELSLSQVPINCQIRPLQIPLYYPIYNSIYKTRICLILKDNNQLTLIQNKLEKQIEKQQQKKNTFMIQKYLTIDDLNEKYKELNQKKQLCKYYDLFFCDFQVYAKLAKIIGPVFFDNRKFPFPIDSQKIPEQLVYKYGNDHEQYLIDQMNYTYFQITKGPIYQLKIGRISMQINDICKNIMHGIYDCIPHLISDNRKHTHIKQINIKTKDSVSMPIYENNL